VLNFDNHLRNNKESVRPQCISVTSLLSSGGRGGGALTVGIRNFILQRSQI
jgi:hypothetical protein